MDLAFECNLCSILKGPQSISTLYVFLRCVRCCFYLRLFSSQKGAKDRISSSNLIATLSENALLLLLLFKMLHVDVRNLFILIFQVFFLILLHGERRRRINTTQHNIKISFRQTNKNKINTNGICKEISKEWRLVLPVCYSFFGFFILGINRNVVGHMFCFFHSIIIQCQRICDQ